MHSTNALSVTDGRQATDSAIETTPVVDALLLEIRLLHIFPSLGINRSPFRRISSARGRILFQKCDFDRGILFQLCDDRRRKKKKKRRRTNNYWNMPTRICVEEKRVHGNRARRDTLIAAVFLYLYTYIRFGDERTTRGIATRGYIRRAEPST